MQAQSRTAAPEPEVSDEPGLTDEEEDRIEEQVEAEAEEGPNQDPLPEDPTPEPAPNIVHEAEGGGALGGAVPPSAEVHTEAVVEDAAEEENAEQERIDIAEEATAGETGVESGGAGEPSTADRLAQANPNSGLPWALPINFSQNLSVWTLSKSVGLTYNPTYSWSFSVRPRWNFANGLSVGVRQDLDIEWTQSDITTDNRQLWWGDTQLDATYTLPWKPAGIMVIPSFLLSAGVSPISRGADRYLGPGGRLLALRPIGVLGGLILGGGVSYTYWIGKHNGGVSPETAFPCQRAGSSQANCGSLGGNTPIRHVASAGIFGTLIPTAGWQINLSFTAIYNKGDRLDDACIGMADGVVHEDGMDLCLGDNSPNRHWRTITSFAFSVGYDVTSYMTLSLGYSTLAFYPDSEGHNENPFYNENSQLSLTLQFRVDGMVVALKADDAEERAEQAAAQALQATAF